MPYMKIRRRLTRQIRPRQRLNFFENFTLAFSVEVICGSFGSELT